MSSRLPPSSKPPSKAEASAHRPRGPKPAAERPKAGQVVAQSTEAKLWAGVDTDQSLQVSMKAVEQRLTQDGAEPEARPARPPSLASKAWRRFKAKMRRRPVAPEPRPSSARAPSAKSSSASAARAKATKLISGRSAHEPPVDAVTLLEEAKAQGVLYRESHRAAGQVEERDPPDLVAAVEECIRLCFGVRGILRIGPGEDEHQTPIVVVTTNRGFSSESLAKVPPRVLGFATLVAVPFELLPLKRER